MQSEQILTYLNHSLVSRSQQNICRTNLHFSLTSLSTQHITTKSIVGFSSTSLRRDHHHQCRSSTTCFAGVHLFLPDNMLDVSHLGLAAEVSSMTGHGLRISARSPALCVSSAEGSSPVSVCRSTHIKKRYTMINLLFLIRKSLYNCITAGTSLRIARTIL